MDRDEKVDVCMEPNIKLMRKLGYLPRVNKLGEKSEKLYLIYSIVVLGSSAVFIATDIYAMSVFFEKWDTASAAIEDISVLMSTIVVLTKTLTVCLNQKRLFKLIDILNRKWNLEYLQEEDEKHIIRKAIKHEKKLIKIFSSISCGIVLSYLSTSIVRIISGLKKSKSEFLGLGLEDFNRKILPVKYPFRISNMFEYICAYFHLVLVMVFTASATISVDCITWSLLHYVTQHVRMLVRKLRIDSDRKTTKENVRRHLELIRCIRDLQIIFGPVLLMQFTLTSLMICLGLFQATQIRSMSTNLYVKNLFYIAWKISQLYMHCSYGQKLTDQSNLINLSLYSTEWYEKKRKQTDQLIMMIRSQTSLQITAAGVFTVSMPTFTKVLQSAYSCFALLYTITQE